MEQQDQIPEDNENSEDSEDSEDSESKNFKVRMSNEFHRADFMEKKGYDVNMLNVSDVELEEDADGDLDSITITGVAPELTKEQKKQMFTEQIARLIHERDEMVDEYDQMADRLRASIDML